MRRILSIIFTLIFVTYFCQAQSFKLIEADHEATGNIGDKIKAVLKVKNVSEAPITLNVKVAGQQLATGQNTSFFWGDQFIQPAMGEKAHSILLNPGQREVSLVSILQGGLSESTSSIRFCVYDINNPQDSVIHEITYHIKDQQTTDLFFQDDQLKVGNIYPNPVSDKAFIEYDLVDPNSKAKVVIHNLLGSIVGEYELDPYEHRIAIEAEDLNPGVYFYSLHLDNKNIITKKFLIRR